MGGRLMATIYRPRREAAGARAGALRARVNKLRWEFSGWLLGTRFTALPWMAAKWHGRLLRRASGPNRASKRGLVAVTPHYGENRLLTAFLDHHRRLGVDLFVFLDLSADGGLAARIGDQADCAVWRSRGEPDPEKAIYWLNWLRGRYADGRWCLSLEPCDLFVFPKCETRQIKDLTDFLDTERRSHLFALTVEMYGDRPAAELGLDPAGQPLAALSYFDPYGYTTSIRSGRFRNVLVRGGVQRRTVFREQPRRTPALNRTPLVKWRWYYCYVAGTRTLMPSRLNKPHPAGHSTPTGALLRFALLHGEPEGSLAARVEAGEVVPDGGGSWFSQLPELRNRALRHGSSERFTSSWDLVECGLANPGQWF